MVWLHIAKNEVIHAGSSANPTFGNLPPYLRTKDVLSYRVLVHLRHVTDFDPDNPSPSPSPPESDDGDSGHDGNPDRHHFSRGSGRGFQGFRCVRGAVDGEAGEHGGSATSSPAEKSKAKVGPEGICAAKAGPTRSNTCTGLL